jgi:hypothetical protein
MRGVMRREMLMVLLVEGLKRREYLAEENGREKNDGKSWREKRAGEKERGRMGGRKMQGS